jgi:uncharacterized protein with PQ loop repeat
MYSTIYSEHEYARSRWMMVGEMFGFVGGSLSMMQALPQARRVRALGHGRGVSLTAWLFTLAANATWLGYGLRIGSPSLVLTNVVSAVLSSAVIVALVDKRAKPMLSLPTAAIAVVLLLLVLPEAVISIVMISLTMSRAPQVLASWRHYKAGAHSAVSMGTVSLSIAGLLCWEVFSFLSGRPLLIVTTTLALSLSVAIAVLERSGERVHEHASAAI